MVVTVLTTQDTYQKAKMTAIDCWIDPILIRTTHGSFGWHCSGLLSLASTWDTLGVSRHVKTRERKCEGIERERETLR